MSRGQMTQTFNTAKDQNQQYNNLANTSFNAAQEDIGKTQGEIGSYGEELAKFKAANPYVTGGQAETAENQQLADTAAGMAESAGQTLQSQAARTGQNAGGAIAATEHMQQENARNLMGQEAGATERRLAAGTGYGEAALGGQATKEGMQAGLTAEQAGLASEEGKLAQGALGIQEGAAQTPSFFDTLGSSFASSLGKTLGGGNFQFSKSL